jgi:hypothetical protein
LETSTTLDLVSLAPNCLGTRCVEKDLVRGGVRESLMNENE